VKIIQSYVGVVNKMVWRKDANIFEKRYYNTMILRQFLDREADAASFIGALSVDFYHDGILFWNK